MRLAFKIAVRFLTSSRVQTILIALGIAIGVAVQVFIGTLITGLQKSLLDNTIGSSSQVTVQGEKTGDTFGGADALVKDIQENQSGITAITAVADASGFLEQSTDDPFAVLFRGFDFDTANDIYKLDNALTEGRLPTGNEVLLGKDLIEQTGFATGDTVDMLTPQGETQSVTISGIYDLKVSSINASWAIGERQLVQQVFGYGEEVTGIEMQVADVFASDSVVKGVEEVVPADLKVTDWQAENQQLLSGLNGQSVSSIMIQVFVMVSVVLAIASVLVISVLQKSRQLGILKAMGIKNRTASAIFLWEGVLLGLFGAALGIGLGLGLSLLFSTFALQPDGTPLIPLTLSPGFIALSGGIAVAAAVVAALIPAYRSSRLDPIEVIKNG